MGGHPENLQRNETICNMRKSGTQPTDIAKTLKLSRNIVLGVLNRHGMCNSNTVKSRYFRKEAFKIKVATYAAATSCYRAAKKFKVSDTTAAIWKKMYI